MKDKFITSNIHTETPMVFVMDPKVDLGTKFIPLQRYSNNLYLTISQSQFQPERTNLGYEYIVELYGYKVNNILKLGS